MNWQPKYFLVCRENFLTQKCVANEKSLEDTALIDPESIEPFFIISKKLKKY